MTEKTAKSIKAKTRRRARSKGWSKERTEKYTWGTLRKAGWKPRKRRKR